MAKKTTSTYTNDLICLRAVDKVGQEEGMRCYQHQRGMSAGKLATEMETVVTDISMVNPDRSTDELFDALEKQMQSKIKNMPMSIKDVEI